MSAFLLAFLFHCNHLTFPCLSFYLFCNADVSPSLFGGGTAEEEETIAKGDDVVVELDATLEDLYMGGSLKVRN